jgi:crotonobetainyl-CoA:carnitine CoA-transferase CaiB-like acyl-CoA transferase
VQRRRDVHLDRQVKHLDLLVERETGHIGRVRQPRPMWQFSDTPALVTSVIGSTGEHTREVLREQGLSEAQIDGLVADGVVAEGAARTTQRPRSA